MWNRLTVGECNFLADVFLPLKSNTVIRPKQQWMQWHTTMHKNIGQLCILYITCTTKLNENYKHIWLKSVMKRRRTHWKTFIVIKSDEHYQWYLVEWKLSKNLAITAWETGLLLENAIFLHTFFCLWKATLSVLNNIECNDIQRKTELSNFHITQIKCTTKRCQLNKN